MNASKREALDFEEKAKGAFSFLLEMGFQITQAGPTHVLFCKGVIEVDVYHGRQSYEIGVGITAYGDRYALSEILRLADPKEFEAFRYPTATTTKQLMPALNKMSDLTQEFGPSALDGDAAYFADLKRQRSVWLQDYEREVLAAKLRPMANKAFHDGDYSKAVELYGQIQHKLSPADLAKFKLAERRAKE